MNQNNALFSEPQAEIIRPTSIFGVNAFTIYGKGRGASFKDRRRYTITSASKFMKIPSIAALPRMRGPWGTVKSSIIKQYNIPTELVAAAVSLDLSEQEVAYFGGIDIESFRAHPRFSGICDALSYAVYVQELIAISAKHGFISENDGKEAIKVLHSIELGRELSYTAIIMAYIEAQGGGNIVNTLEKALDSVTTKIPSADGGKDFNIRSLSEFHARTDLARYRSEDQVVLLNPDVSNLGQLQFVPETQVFDEYKPSITIEGLMCVTSIPGRFGKGNIIKTHSLFPGESATLTVETFKKSSRSSSGTASIFESSEEGAENNFSDEVSQSRRETNEKSRETKTRVGGSASAKWGWGSASISAEASKKCRSSSSVTRDSASKAIRKHSDTVSKKRSVSVETTTTEQVEEGRSTSIVRTIQNVNAGTPLNFLFMQIIQEFLCITTIRDVAVIARNGPGDAGTSLRLEEIPEYLFDNPKFVEMMHPDDIGHVSLEGIKKIYKEIIYSARAMAVTASDDDLGDVFIVEHGNFQGITTYRVNPALVRRHDSSKKSVDYKAIACEKCLSDIDDAIHRQIIRDSPMIDGVVLDTTYASLQTDGVMVECFMSDNKGLDEYSDALQKNAISQKTIANSYQELRNTSVEQALRLLDDAQNTDEKLAIIEMLLRAYSETCPDKS